MSTSTDSDEKESPWYQTWFALTYDRLEAEMKLYRETQSSLQDEWDEESKKYEEEITLTVKDLMGNDLTITVPRRNYFNAEGTVTDVTLFPYHKAFYALLDAYDSLNVNIHHYTLLSSNASRPFPLRFTQNRLSFMDIDADDSPLFLPCSNEATSWTLGCHPGPPGRNIDEHRPMFWYGLECILLDHRHSFPPYYRDIVGEEKYFKVVVEKMIFPSDDASYTRTAKKWYTTGPYGPIALPGDQMEQIVLLLKILRHALSELQRDYRLASCVLLLMIRLRYPGDVSVFRKMLAIIDSAYCHPIGSSNERDFYEFHRAIAFHIIHTGIIRYTQELDHCLSAFVRTTFVREFPTLLPDDKKEESVIGKRKKLLVRAVVARQAEDFDERDVRNNDDAGKIPIVFIETLIRSLGCRGFLERVNQFDHLDTSTPADYPERKGLFRKSLESYENIVRSLVSIANSVIQILPEGERYYGIASELVLSLCRCMRKEEHFATFWGGIDEYHHFKTFGYISTDKYGDGGTVRLQPLRYTHGITNSTAIIAEKKLHRDRYKLQPVDSMGFMRDEFVEIFHRKPKQDVLDAVRGLFLRNLVDIRVSAVGYGDFLVLCDYEITPLDPMLDWTEYAYPDEEGSDDDDDDEEESLEEGDRLANWVDDEAGDMLTYNDLRARNDLQLVLLQRAWQAQWTPATHASFQPSFRVAVATIAKSIHHLGFPHEIMLAICSFLHRDWWDDQRKHCWNYACLSEKSTKAISRKMAPGYSAATIDDHQDASVHLEYCRRCHVAMYCSKTCKSRDSYLGHKARCCPAMSKPPMDDEIKLYTKILVGDDDKATLPVFLNSWAHLSNVSTVENICKEGRTTADGASNCVHMEEVGDGENDGDDAVGDGENDDDDASWETMDSDEDEGKDAVADESKMSITQLVRRYFDDRK